MKTILTVDDDQFITSMYKSRLRQEGYNAVSANTAEEALAMLENGRPDLIMLDLNLPGTNGAELLRAIRARPETEKTPVVVLSHGYVQHLVDEVFELGILKLFPKATCPPNKVVAELKELLSSLPD